ncbi:MAG: NUDIX hydrolase [Anaerolineales bacterium]|nr:NUDIX hydrolase [Anaerolineales bacterium]
MLLLRWRPIRWCLQVAVRLFAPRHRIGITAVVINAHSEILLLHHVFHPTIPWGAPGGWLDAGEAPLHGALRELQEETGIIATDATLIYMRREKLPDHLGIAYLIHLSESDTAPPESLTLSHEINTAKWFTAAELPRLTSFTREAIKIALEMIHSQKQPLFNTPTLTNKQTQNHPESS